MSINIDTSNKVGPTVDIYNWFHDIEVQLWPSVTNCRMTHQPKPTQKLLIKGWGRPI